MIEPSKIDSAPRSLTTRYGRAIRNRMDMVSGSWLGPCAWLVAFLGTVLLPDPRSRIWGVTLILLASALAVIVFRHVPLPGTSYHSL